MTDYRKTKFYKTLDSFKACSIAEGFCEGADASEEEQLTAWQWLIDNGTCWNLQGWYGRTAVSLVEEGLIKPPIKDRVGYYGNVVVGTGD